MSALLHPFIEMKLTGENRGVEGKVAIHLCLIGMKCVMYAFRFPLLIIMPASVRGRKKGTAILECCCSD